MILLAAALAVNTYAEQVINLDYLCDLSAWYCCLLHSQMTCNCNADKLCSRRTAMHRSTAWSAIATPVSLALHPAVTSRAANALYLFCLVLLLLASQTHMIDVVASPSLVAQAAKIAVRHIVGYSSHEVGMSWLLTGHVQVPEVCTSCGLALRTNPDQSGQMPVTWSALVWACTQKKAVAQVYSNGSLYMENRSSQGNKGCERASASRTRPHDQCTWCVCAGASDT